MKVAIYRIHYGTDFLLESINSIINDVDKIVIFYSKKPWIEVDKIKYKNKYINFPKNPENVKEFIINNLFHKKIFYFNYECNTPKNQFGKLFEIVINKFKIKPKYILFIEPDMMFGKNQLNLLKFELNLKFWTNHISSRQIEIWKFNKFLKSNKSYRIPLRKKRVGPVLWKIKNNQKIETHFGGEPSCKSKRLSTFVTTLNLGFSINENSMFYKHLMAIVFSKVIGDSEPDENWYDEKWLNWNENLENLEISKGFQHNIKRAFKYKIPYKFFQFFK